MISVCHACWIVLRVSLCVPIVVKESGIMYELLRFCIKEIFVDIIVVVIFRNRKQIKLFKLSAVVV